MGVPLNDILKVAIKGGASDIHLKSGLPPMFRVDGALVPLKNGDRMMPDEIQRIAAEIMNPVQKARFEEHREADLAYGIAGLGRFRVNVFQQRGTYGIVFRVIPFGVKTLEQLCLPQVVEQIGREQAAHFMEDWRALAVVCAKGEMLQVDCRGRKPGEAPDLREE